MDTRIANQNANPPCGMPLHQNNTGQDSNSSPALKRRSAPAGDLELMDVHNDR